MKLKITDHTLKLPRLNPRLRHAVQRLDLENKRLDSETDAMRQENVLMKRLVRRGGVRIAFACLLAMLFTGCVVVQTQTPSPANTSAPAPATNQTRILRAAPMPPMPPPPMKVVKMTPPPTFTARFTCLSVMLSMANKEVRDERGIGTGQWEAERRYVVTLQPLHDGTNGIITWGASRDGMIKLVTTADEFQQGKIYEFQISP